MSFMRNEENHCYMLRRLPDAVAVVGGRSENSGPYGTVKFYGSESGVLVVADILGLPAPALECEGRIFGFHIHDGSECSGNDADPFADAGSHYNPSGCPHPYHAGDMPPLFGAGGRAFLAFLTDRVSVDEIIGKAVVIHDRPDDFTTQPSGNAGNKIACGVISRVRR